MTRGSTGTTVGPAGLSTWRRLTLIEGANDGRAQTRECAKFSAGRSGRDANDDMASESQTRRGQQAVLLLLRGCRRPAQRVKPPHGAFRAYIVGPVGSSRVTARKAGPWGKREREHCEQRNER